jgi:hypothetical protein
MADLSKYPARVTRHVAMELLCIVDPRVFRKVIDANPDLAHRLPGEKKAKYLLAIIARLMEPENCESRCATGTLEGKKSPKPKVQSPKLDGQRQRARTP